MNFFARLANVFVAPDACFTSIKDKGTKWTDYVIPFVLLIAMVIVFLAVSADIVQQETIDAIQKMEQLSETQKETAIQQSNSSIAITMRYVFASITTIIVAFFTALIFWMVGNFIGSGEQKFSTILVAALYIQMISIPESIIKMVLVLQKGAMNVFLGFGSLVAQPDLSSFWFQLLAQFEFFKIWRIIVWVIAFKVLYKYSTKKSTLLVGITMLIGIIISALLSSLQMGRMG